MLSTASLPNLAMRAQMNESIFPSLWFVPHPVVAGSRLRAHTGTLQPRVDVEDTFYVLSLLEVGVKLRTGALLGSGD